MNILALDIGLKRTGVAFADSAVGVPLSLDTIHHNGIEDLVEPVQSLLKSKQIDHLVLGLPKLPSGDEGEQCAIVRDFAALLDDAPPYSFIDERFTSFTSAADVDASAATQVLLTYLEKNS